jgi:nucleotide-binding universal stress UspA family protein
MIKKILVPTDGSRNSLTAMEFAVYMARRLGASLFGLHVVDIGLIQGPVITDVAGAVGMPPYEGFFDAVEKALNEKADFILKEFQDRCRRGGVKSDVRKITGKVSTTIIEEARETDMILMAKKGEHDHLGEGGILGSVAEYVVRNAGKPVMVTPEKFFEIESMGLAYDGSGSAVKALHLALNLSAQTAWPVTVITVTADSQKAAEWGAQVEAVNQAEPDEPPIADCDVVHFTGKETEEILNFIKEGAVELMVMGAFGHNRLRELLLGSTTSQIIRKSPIPVLLIR